MVYKANEKEAIEKFFGKKICTEKLNIENVPEPIEFDLYDGYARGVDKEGNVWDMEYPKTEFVRSNQNLTDSVKDYVANVDGITPINVMLTFNKLYKNGVLIYSN